MPAIVVGSMRHDRRKHPYPQHLRKRNESSRLEKIHGVNLLETNARVLALIQVRVAVLGQ